MKYVAQITLYRNRNMQINWSEDHPVYILQKEEQW